MGENKLEHVAQQEDCYLAPEVKEIEQMEEEAKKVRIVFIWKGLHSPCFIYFRQCTSWSMCGWMWLSKSHFTSAPSTVSTWHSRLRNGWPTHGVSRAKFTSICRQFIYWQLVEALLFQWCWWLFMLAIRLPPEHIECGAIKHTRYVQFILKKIMTEVYHTPRESNPQRPFWASVPPPVQLLRGPRFNNIIFNSGKLRRATILPYRNDNVNSG